MSADRDAANFSGPRLADPDMAGTSVLGAGMINEPVRTLIEIAAPRDKSWRETASRVPAWRKNKKSPERAALKFTADKMSVVTAQGFSISKLCEAAIGNILRHE